MIEKFQSRKFMLTVAFAAAAAAAGQWPQALTLVLAYLGVEGIIDVRAVARTTRAVAEAVDEADDDVVQPDGNTYDPYEDEDEDDEAYYEPPTAVGFTSGRVPPAPRA
jgi:hypothetical protein